MSEGMKGFFDRLPAYEEALAKLAEEAGCTPEELQRRLDETRERISKMITPECLTFGEIERWPHISSKRTEHVRNCEFCKEVIEATEPGRKYLREKYPEPPAGC